MLSKCCDAEVRTEGNTTRYYVCNKCDKACEGIGNRGK